MALLLLPLISPSHIKPRAQLYHISVLGEERLSVIILELSQTRENLNYLNYMFHNRITKPTSFPDTINRI